MSPESQRIAIAEACGWKNLETRTGCGTLIGEHPNVPEKFRQRYDGRWASQVPDYLHDLNACHEMEKVLTNSQRVDYCNRLVRMLYDNFHSAIQATPAQRCEAFLRTLNLWKDNQ